MYCQIVEVEIAAAAMASAAIASEDMTVSAIALDAAVRVEIAGADCSSGDSSDDGGDNDAA